MGASVFDSSVAAPETEVTDSSLEFVRGSHRWNEYFTPTAFDDETGDDRFAVGWTR